MTTVVIPDNGKLDDLKETLSKSGVEIKDVNPKSLVSAVSVSPSQQQQQKQQPASQPAGNVPNNLKKPVFLEVRKNIEVFFKPEEILHLGKKTNKKAYLVVGLPTVKRTKAFYLLDTIRGLVNGLKESQRSEVIILVFIADQNAEYRKKVKTSVSEQFSSLVESGNIQVIVAPPAFYPPNLHTLPRLYGDTPARVAWRSKQSLDYSFMYYYAGGLGEYYLQLEDDVITEDNYLTSIKEYINSRTQPWSTLEFGSRGFIGMLYKAEHLTSLARYCRLYFWTMPIDWLFRFYNDIFLHGNSVNNVRKPPLFKHIGAFSSLDGQIRKLEDIASNAGKSEVIPRAFKDADNPKVIVRTSIVDFVPPHSIETAYLKGTGYFWGKTIKIGDSVTLILEQPKKLKKVAISSGSPLYPSDALENGEVLLSPDTNGKCGDYTSIHSFKSKAEVVVDNIGVSFLVKCVQFKLNSVRMDDHGRPRWLVIKEIAIWTAKVK